MTSDWGAAVQQNPVGKTDLQSSSDYLISRTHSWLCAFPLAHIGETMRPQRCEPLANGPSFLRGVSIIRGAAVPVVDLAMLLGSATPGQTSRIVTLNLGEQRIAVAVGSVVGVRAITHSSVEETPPLLRQIADETVAAIATLDEQLLYILKTACLVPDSVWQAMTSVSVLS